MSFDFIPSALAKRRAEGLFRQPTKIDAVDGANIRIGGKQYINFASNDYLGLSQSSSVKQAWQQGIDLYGCGSGASPLVTGYSKAHCELETYLAERLQRQRVMLFNSGFAANSAICQSLMLQGGNIIADKLIHASIIDGALASKGNLQRFRHNDINHLADLLNTANTNNLVAVEGIYSMDGDAAPVVTLAALCQQRQSMLMVDDAHGFGVLGDSGLGSMESANLGPNDVPLLMATFGKAVGTAGAFVATSNDIADYLQNFARDYIYSTMMPPAQAVATLASLQLIEQQPQLRQQLRNNIQLFRDLSLQHELPLGISESAIQPIMIGDPKKALMLSNKLKDKGFWVTAIRQPTVPKGTDRLRVTISAIHNPVQIQQLVINMALTLNE
ncbi:8-amino-7-oxononanoate synthase [Alteromonadaceae bacterium BrNp21-10]|nr:8-amino-7-oxononanoate synthase [Alteromonadaceae bacterium BrNp21-10]